MCFSDEGDEPFNDLNVMDDDDNSAAVLGGGGVRGVRG